VIELSTQLKTIKIYAMGQEYSVPAELTIMKAMEYIGYKYIRGIGCRGGFCGACATVYRVKNDYKLYTGLACQTTVKDGMYLAQIPFVPAEKQRYDIDTLKPDSSMVMGLYPEVARCVSCNSCTKACPQELEVMDAIQSILRGDLAKTTNFTFDCIACGMCSLRCPAEIQHANVFQLIRRLSGKYILKKSKNLAERSKEIEAGKYEQQLREYMKKSVEELRKAYSERVIEPV
jgi:formate hydrogenlyase subunit 6/NADH:ubiquinone oxidoreductase subunit I